MIVIALGSNLGNRLYNLWQAVGLLQEQCLKNIRCSLVLETEPIFPETTEEIPLSWHKPYLNMIVSGETHLSPDALLDKLLSIEKFMGRVRSKHWEPRIIDLDILFYKNETISSPHLVVPHPEINNRPFLKHLLSLMRIKPWENQYYKNSFVNSFTINPCLVGIVNVTQDSFSDGGKFFHVDNAVEQIMHLAESGAGIIDIGAQSTRPGGIIYSCEEEYKKLTEVLDAIKPLLENETLHVSIDTFHMSLIKRLLKRYKISWINCIQDRCLDDDTLKMMVDYGCKLCVMHSLSVPPTQDIILSLEGDHPIDILKTWGEGLIERLLKIGFSLKDIILDPGIGFGKNYQQNIDLLKHVNQLKDLGTLILIGHSRKSYMESFCEKPAAQRDMETVAISLMLNNKVDFLRVHNVDWHRRAFVAQHVLA